MVLPWSDMYHEFEHAVWHHGSQMVDVPQVRKGVFYWDLFQNCAGGCAKYPDRGLPVGTKTPG